MSVSGAGTVLQDPRTHSPAQAIDVVVVRANDKYRQYYAGAYDPDEEHGKPPQCYSVNGVTPAVDAEVR